MTRSISWRLFGTALAVVGVTLLLAPGALADHRVGHQGPKFKFSGTSRIAQDQEPPPPGNPSNDVVRMTSDGAGVFGAIARKLNTKIYRLDNEIEAKAFFYAPHMCGLGSPRWALALDFNHDGRSDGNAFGNFGPGPFGTGCPPVMLWHYEDGTDAAPRWDVTQLTNCPGPPAPCPPRLVLPPGLNPFLVPWQTMEDLIMAQFPNHNVCAGRFVDDNGSPPGTADYDLISIGNRTWNNRKQGHGHGDPFESRHGPCHGHHGHR